jgi:quercetin dioxygenase-like cupin family protein
MEIVTDEHVEPTEAMPGVHLTQGAAGERASIQRFRIEPGATVPEHAHPHEQIGTVTGGVLTLVVDGEDRPVRAGDTFVIPGDEPHAARNDGDRPATGVEVFSPARPNPDWES